MSKWDKRIAKAEKFLQSAQEHGKKVYARYQDNRDGDGGGRNLKRANIFYSNVNTLKESLFNSLPKPDVSRLHRGDYADDPSRVAALIMQRALQYEVQCAEDFKQAVRYAILDRLVPGIGQVWVRFDVDTTEEMVAEGEDPATIPIGGSEKIYVESVYWEDFLYEPARNWTDVKWAGRRLELSRDEVIERWGEDVLDSLAMVKSKGTNNTPKEITEGKFEVYEIWDKRTMSVLHIAKGMDKPLDEKPDPYKLRGFFPFPAPLIANVTTSAYLPVTDYHISQDQYNQLDVLYARIALIIDAVKVAGLYDASSDSIGKMLEGQENKLIPVNDWAMFVEKGGAAGGIQWYPVEQVVSVLQSLQQQFEAVKAILFEVSGMSDIIRGSTNQYETAAAQQIKAQFASVRMNGYQRDVSEFVSGIINIMGEIITQLYSDDKLKAIVGQLNEADIQYVPSAVQILRNDLLSTYKITIQADSLVQADWALEKGQRMELMGYMSQFLSSAVPAIQQSPEMAPLLLTMMKFTMTGYRGGAEIEGAIDQELDSMMKASSQPKPSPPPSPEEKKAQAEMQMMQLEGQQKQQEGQQRMAEGQQSMQLEQQKAQAKLEADAASLQMKQQANEQELAHKERLNQMEIAMMDRKLAYMEREQSIKLQMTQIQGAIKLQQGADSHEQKMEHAEAAANVQDSESGGETD